MKIFCLGLGTPRSIRPLTQAFKDAQSDNKASFLFLLLSLVLAVHFLPSVLQILSNYMMIRM
jgi:hypothetical protein